MTTTPTSAAHLTALLSQAASQACAAEQARRVAAGLRGLNSVERRAVGAAARDALRAAIDARTPGLRRELHTRGQALAAAAAARQIAAEAAAEAASTPMPAVLAAVDAAVDALVAGGWSIDSRSPLSESVYLARGSARVRVSAHALPATDARAHALEHHHSSTHGVVVCDLTRSGAQVLRPVADIAADIAAYTTD